MRYLGESRIECPLCLGHGTHESGRTCVLCAGCGDVGLDYYETPLLDLPPVRHEPRGSTIWSPLLCGEDTIDRMTRMEKPVSKHERVWHVKLSCGHEYDVSTFIGDFDYMEFHRQASDLVDVCIDCKLGGQEDYVVELVSATLLDQQGEDDGVVA